MSGRQIAGSGGELPAWAGQLIARAKKRGHLWDAEIIEVQPMLINTPGLFDWIRRFEELGIEVRLSVVQLTDDVRRSWVQARRLQLEHQLVTYKNRLLLDGAQTNVSDLATAEHRLDDGEFGRCVWCETWIEREVLKAIPEKLYCSPECATLSREAAKRHDDEHRGDVFVNPPSSRTLMEVRALSAHPSGVWPIVLSCNMRRKCWPATFGRFTPDDRRTYIDGRNEFLDAVVRLVLKHRYYGGQFAIYSDRIAWAGSGATIHSY
jgi:RNA polymerase-binding transcription factor DksA